MIKFNIQGTANAQRLIRRRMTMVQKAPGEVMQQIAQQQVQEVQQRIVSTKRDAEGRAWAPWSFNTMRSRIREGSAGRGLLNRTGELLRSITYRISEKTLTIFSNAPHAKFLQQGTFKMPARPFLGWSKDALNKIKQTMIKAVSK